MGNDNSNVGNGSNFASKEYSDFPSFGRKPNHISYKKEARYIRCSMDYSNATEEETNNYINLITNNGYIRMTNIRFERDNTYIIVDPDARYGLNIVFHIKK